MHSAPSVSYPVGRCAFQRATLVVLSFMTCTVMLVWFLCQPVSWVLCLGGVATLLGVVLGWRSLRAQTGILSWDGHVWCWHSRAHGFEDQIGQVFVSLDSQKALVLRWQPSSGRLITSVGYLWLSQEVAKPRWLNLRCAVFSRSPQR
jgi:hypothetical protein